MSVDMPDAHPDYVAEDLTFNDQESFVELIVEKVCGFGNIIEEHDEPDDDAREFEMNKEFKVYANLLPLVVFVRPSTNLFHYTPFQEDSFPEFFSEINPPPPKV